MTQLKTLKDLEVNCCGAGEYCTHEDGGYHQSVTDKSLMVHSSDLKQEAIKWAKVLRIDDNLNYKDGVVEWICTFFNLTPKDLK